MTNPVTPPSVQSGYTQTAGDAALAPAAPKVSSTHTWVVIGANLLSLIATAFAPKLQAYAAAHPLGALAVGAAATTVAGVLPSATGAGQPSAPTTP